MLLKLAGLLLLAYLVFRVFRRPAPRRPADRPAESMVRCVRCGVHLPRGDAVFHHGYPYCGSRCAGPDTLK